MALVGGVHRISIFAWLLSQITWAITACGWFGETDLNSELFSEIVVLPSDYGETNGNVLLEASQYNCSLIASNRVGIHPEIITNQTGLVFEASRKDELTKQIQLLTYNKILREKFKENNLKFSKIIQPKYAADKITQILKNYEF